MRSGIAATVLAIPGVREEEVWCNRGAVCTRLRRAALWTGLITTGLARVARRSLQSWNTLPNLHL
jgi:hypothetical protein